MHDPTARPRLRELQNWMRWVITDPRGVEPALSDLSRATEPSPRLLHVVSAHSPLSAPERLSIYAEGYFSRLVESLGADFGALQMSLGEESFSILVADYLRTHPTMTYNIGEVGEKLPGFLARHELGIEYPQLAELASLEWAVVESFYADEHAADPAHLNPLALQSIAPEAWPGARFELAASVRFQLSAHTVERVWRKRHDDAELTTELQELGDSPAGSGLLLFREASGAVSVERLERAPFEVLRQMSRGATLAEICERLESGNGDALPPLMQWFSGWVANGVIASIKGGLC